MNECRRTPPPGEAGKTAAAGKSARGTPGSVASPSRGRAESVSRLLEAFAEHEHTVSLLLAAVLRLCLPGTDQGMDDADGPGANRTVRGGRPNG